MIGEFGCPCNRCRGGGTLAMQVRSKLCALERLLKVDLVVTMGYRCREEANVLGLHPTESGHCATKDEEGEALAVDFFPRDPTTYSSDRMERDGKKWGNRRYDFLEVCRPFFDKVWICVSETDSRKWSVHGEIGGDTIKQVTVKGEDHTNG